MKDAAYGKGYDHDRAALGRQRLVRWACAILLLMPTAPAWAAESHVGRWAIDPAGCVSEGDTARTAPLIVTTTTLKWFVASCTIGKMYKAGTALYIEARCLNEGRRRTMPVTLDMKGQHLVVTWNGTRVEEMKRCH